MTVYVVAQRQAPVIWCPSWCETSEHHLPELGEWDGRAVHVGHWPSPNDDGPHLGLGVTLLPDGQADDASELSVNIAGRSLTLAQAEVFAATLAQVIATGRLDEVAINEPGKQSEEM